MTRHRKFSNCRAMVLAGILALLCNAKAFPVDVTSGDWPELNHDKLGTRYSPLASINTSNAKNLKIVCEYKFPDKEDEAAHNRSLGLGSPGRVLNTLSRNGVQPERARERLRL